VPVVVGGPIRIVQEGLSALEVDEPLGDRACRRLRESVEVKDVLPLRDHVIQGEVGSCPNEEAITDLILAGVQGDDIPDIMELGRVELREVVQLRVEEDVVEPDIGQQDNSAVLTSRPPGGKAKEGFLILLLVGD
jgi:hypothetical protein